MLEFARWKYVVMALVLLASVFYALPNIYPSDPSVQIVANKGATVDAALTTRVEGLLKGAKLQAKSVGIEGDSLVVRMPNSDAQTRANDLLRPSLGDSYTVALNLAPTVPGWLKAIGAKPMSLGLDLQGGVHFLMEVDQAAAREKRENAYVEEIRGLLRDKKIRYSEVSRSGDGLRIQLSNAGDRDAALNQLATGVPRLPFRRWQRHPDHRPGAVRTKSRRSPTTRSSRTSPPCATASTTSVSPSRSSSARAATASSCSCRACRTPKRPSASLARPRPWNSAPSSKVMPPSRCATAPSRRTRATTATPTSACRSCCRKRLLVSGDQLVEATPGHRPAERHAERQHQARQRRRQAHVRLHARERRQAHGHRLCRAHPDHDPGRWQGSAFVPDRGTRHQRLDGAGRVRQEFPDHRPEPRRGQQTWPAAASPARWPRRWTSSRNASSAPASAPRTSSAACRR